MEIKFEKLFVVGYLLLIASIIFGIVRYFLVEEIEVMDILQVSRNVFSTLATICIILSVNFKNNFNINLKN